VGWQVDGLLNAVSELNPGVDTRPMPTSTATVPHKGPSFTYPTGDGLHASRPGSEGHSPGRPSHRDEVGGRHPHWGFCGPSPLRSISPLIYRPHGTAQADYGPHQAMPDWHRQPPDVSGFQPALRVARGVDHGQDALDAPPWQNPGEWAAVPGPGFHPAAGQVVRLHPHVTVGGGEVVCSVLCCATGGRDPDSLDADAAKCDIEIQVPDDLSPEEADEMMFGGPSVGYLSDYVAFPNPYPMSDGEFKAAIEGTAVVIHNLPGMPVPDPWDAGVEDGELDPIQGVSAPCFPPGFAPILAPFAPPISSIAVPGPADASASGAGTTPKTTPIGRKASLRAAVSAKAAGQQDFDHSSDNAAVRVMNVPGSVRAGTGPTLSDVFAYLNRRELGDSIDFVYLYDCTEQPRGAQVCLLIHARLREDGVKLKKHLKKWRVQGLPPGEVTVRHGQGLHELQNRFVKQHHLVLTGPPSSYDFSSFRGPLPIEFFAKPSRATPLEGLEPAGMYPAGTEPRVTSPTLPPAGLPAALPPPARQGKRQRAGWTAATSQTTASPTPPRDASPPRPSKRGRTATPASIPEAQPVNLPVKGRDAGPLKRPLTPDTSPPSPGPADVGPSKRPRRNPVVWTPQDELSASNKPREKPGTLEEPGSIGKGTPSGKAGVSGGVAPNKEARTAASFALSSPACGPNSGMPEMGQTCPMSVPQEGGEQLATSDVPGAEPFWPPLSAPQDDGGKCATVDPVGARSPMHQNAQGLEPSSNGFSTAPAVDIAAETSQHRTDAVPAAEETQSAILGVIWPSTDAKTVAGHLLPCVEDRRALTTSAASPPVAEGPCPPPTTNGVLGSMRVTQDSRRSLPVTGGTAAGNQGCTLSCTGAM
jgi:hypothetical protein